MQEPRVVVYAARKRSCRTILELNEDCIESLKKELTEREVAMSRRANAPMPPWDAVIVIVNPDDIHGRQIVNALMPAVDWQEVRDRGETPFFVRKLAARGGIQNALGTFDDEAATKLRRTRGVAVVVVDHGVAEVFAA